MSFLRSIACFDVLIAHVLLTLHFAFDAQSNMLSSLTRYDRIILASRAVVVSTASFSLSPKPNDPTSLLLIAARRRSRACIGKLTSEEVNDTV